MPGQSNELCKDPQKTSRPKNTLSIDCRENRETLDTQPPYLAGIVVLYDGSVSYNRFAMLCVFCESGNTWIYIHLSSTLQGRRNQHSNKITYLHHSPELCCTGWPIWISCVTAFRDTPMDWIIPGNTLTCWAKIQCMVSKELMLWELGYTSSKHFFTQTVVILASFKGCLNRCLWNPVAGSLQDFDVKRLGLCTPNWSHLHLELPQLPLVAPRNWVHKRPTLLYLVRKKNAHMHTNKCTYTNRKKKVLESS